MKNTITFFAVLMMALAMPKVANAYDFSAVSPSGDTLYYSINGNSATVVTPGYGNSGYWHGHTKPTGNLIIPELVSYMGMTLPVTSIGEEAFMYCQDITSVLIPRTVTSIGWYAFCMCNNLASVILPDSLTYIDGWAFAFCSSLTSISIPNSVGIIQPNSFKDCTGLISLTVPSSVTSIGSNAFDGCSNISYLSYNTNAFSPATYRPL